MNTNLSLLNSITDVSLNSPSPGPPNAITQLVSGVKLHTEREKSNLAVIASGKLN